MPKETFGKLQQATESFHKGGMKKNEPAIANYQQACTKKEPVVASYDQVGTKNEPAITEAGNAPKGKIPFGIFSSIRPTNFQGNTPSASSLLDTPIDEPLPSHAPIGPPLDVKGNLPDQSAHPLGNSVDITHDDSPRKGAGLQKSQATTPELSVIKDEAKQKDAQKKMTTDLLTDQPFTVAAPNYKGLGGDNGASKGGPDLIQFPSQPPTLPDRLSKNINVEPKTPDLLTGGPLGAFFMNRSYKPTSDLPPGGPVGDTPRERLDNAIMAMFLHNRSKNQPSTSDAKFPDPPHDRSGSLFPQSGTDPRLTRSGPDLGTLFRTRSLFPMALGTQLPEAAGRDPTIAGSATPGTSTPGMSAPGMSAPGISTPDTLTAGMSTLGISATGVSKPLGQDSDQYDPDHPDFDFNKYLNPITGLYKCAFPGCT